MNGTATGKDPKTPSGILLPNLAICNKKPVNGKSAAEEFKGQLMGADTGNTTIDFSYPADDFACFSSPTPPNPDPAPTYPKPLGVACKGTDDNASGKTCGNTDDKTDYCCGVMTGGVLMGNDNKPTTQAVTPNIVVCNYDPGADGESGENKPSDIIDQIEDNGVRVTAKYDGAKFVCLTGAKALVASAVALVAAATMM